MHSCVQAFYAKNPRSEIGVSFCNGDRLPIERWHREGLIVDQLSRKVLRLGPNFVGLRVCTSFENDKKWLFRFALTCIFGKVGGAILQI